MEQQIIAKIKDLSALIQDQLVEWRNHLHRWPELSFQEYKTSAFLQQILDQYGISYQTGFAQNGIVGTLTGDLKSDRVVALRADMDALPIQENNECSYASQNSGIMHACGHDVHMTWLLGALVILQQMRSQWGGTIKFIFQPGEEKLPGGASLMIAEGVLANPRPQVILGQHVQPGMAVGVVGLKPGQFMASCDELYINILGKGGHAALAHLCIDPIKIASEVIMALHDLAADKNIDNQALVLRVGKLNSIGGATNIIPDQVKMEGTLRCLDEGFRKYMHERIRTTVETICSRYEAQAEILIELGYPSLINDESYTMKSEKLAEQFLGVDQVERLQTRMTSEDFSYYSQVVPAVFYRTGIGREVSVHNPNFDIDPRCLPVGAGLMAFLAMSIHADASI